MTIRPLDPDTWPAFAALAERHNGVWGGCWCTWFHRETHSAPNPDEPRSAEAIRDFKRQLVDSGHSHAALVFDGDRAVGWAQLYNGSRSLFERVGFSSSRPKGKAHCVMAIRVPARD